MKSGGDRAKIASFTGHRLIPCRWVQTSTDSSTSLLTYEDFWEQDFAGIYQGISGTSPNNPLGDFPLHRKFG